MTAQLWDEDAISDDFLASAVISGTHPHFRADFTFKLSAASSPDSPMELTPDLYVLVEDAHRQEAFRSKVLKNVDCGGRREDQSPSVHTLEINFEQA